MVQTAPNAPNQISDQQFNQPISPEQISRLQDVCQRLKLKSLNQIEFLPRSSNFLVEFTIESKQPWMGHYTELLEALEAEVDGKVEMVTSIGYERVAKESVDEAVIIQRIYPNG